MAKYTYLPTYPKVSQGLISTDRRKQDLLFSVIATYCAGLFLCKTKGKRDIKVCLLLFTCSLSRGVHLEILSNQTTRIYISIKATNSKEGQTKSNIFR